MKKLTWLLSLLCAGFLSVGLTACDQALLDWFDKDFSKNSSNSETSFSENLTYTLSEDKTHYSVEGIGTCTDSDIVIPSTHEGLPVKAIDREAFKGNANIQSVVIANSVTAIYDEAFAGCKNLNRITLPDSVTFIYPYAFNSCNNLTDVHITSLEAWCNILFANEYSNPLCYAENFYVNDELLTQFVIPETISTVNNLAFFRYDKLTSVIFHNGVTEIKADAFKFCTNLTDVYAPDLSSWFTLSFGNGYSNPLCYAKNWYVNNSPVTELVIPDGITNVRPYTLGVAANVTKAIIPDHVTAIDPFAFAECGNLTSVVISDSVTSIGSWAFGNCTNLTSIIIPDSVTSINDSTFNGCSNLETVIIGDGVTTVQDNAFRGCSNLTEITVGKSVTSFGQFAFEGCAKLTRVNIADVAAWCNISFTSNPLSVAKNLYLNGELVTELIIPDTATEIKTNAFSNCESLTSVIIGKNVTKIGIWAFVNCTNLTNVVVGDDVTFIDEYAFNFCTVLTNITLGEKVDCISYLAFRGCENLANAIFKNPIGWKSNGSSLDFSDTEEAANILKNASFDLLRDKI